MLVRYIEDEAALDRVADGEHVLAVESRTPSLEEVFVAYMRMEASPPSPTEESPVLVV
jgi:hypothetical protein